MAKKFLYLFLIYFTIFLLIIFLWTVVYPLNYTLAFINISPQKINTYLISFPKTIFRVDVFLVPLLRKEGETVTVIGRIGDIFFDEEGKPCFVIFNKLAKIQICSLKRKIIFIDKNSKIKLNANQWLVPTLEITAEEKKMFLNKPIVVPGIELKNDKLFSKHISVYESN